MGYGLAWTIIGTLAAGTAGGFVGSASFLAPRLSPEAFETGFVIVALFLSVITAAFGALVGAPLGFIASLGVNAVRVYRIHRGFSSLTSAQWIVMACVAWVVMFAPAWWITNIEVESGFRQLVGLGAC